MELSSDLPAVSSYRIKPAFTALTDVWLCLCWTIPAHLAVSAVGVGLEALRGTQSSPSGGGSPRSWEGVTHPRSGLLSSAPERLRRQKGISGKVTELGKELPASSCSEVA